MPVFALAYGSLGDILATAQLVAKIIIFLRSDHHSVECAETEKELKSLGTDLANLTLILVDDALQASPFALSVASRVKEEVRRCHLLLLRFFEKSSASSGLIHKLLWVASEERALAAFRMHVVERRAALGAVVAMMNSGMLLAVQDRVNQIGTNSQIRDAVQEGVSGLTQLLTMYQQQIVAALHRVPRGVTE
ncbi:hypothetical protein MVEN_00775800 [Mycena venus]|uniref:Fungal N-terminal domain-containing protein n=1 Tax=Mycena venus TaxID=2733690 RepID=A0A8H6YLG6_9AGAR|nr:hypothetical protein MVEN_00775800 [Mycena venus]